MPSIVLRSWYMWRDFLWPNMNVLIVFLFEVALNLSISINYTEWSINVYHKFGRHKPKHPQALKILYIKYISMLQELHCHSNTNMVFVMEQFCSLFSRLLHCHLGEVLMGQPWSIHVYPYELITSWWRHQTETFPRYWSFVQGIHRSPVNTPHKGQWRWALMLSLICAWINDWVNNREAGDLRRHRAHCDVTVMITRKTEHDETACMLSRICTCGSSFTMRIITVVSHEHHGIANHRQFRCLFNSLLRLTAQSLSVCGIHQ